MLYSIRMIVVKKKMYDSWNAHKDTPSRVISNPLGLAR
jgi:hypothetical protein